ncbi:MAG: class I SAM-dependent methyltransferase [Acidimicrobiales bacterium]
MTNPAEHWDAVYAAKATNEVSWFEIEPITSLRLLKQWASSSDSVVDVGAGVSTLVDSLVDAGWADVTVLDLSQEALNKVRDRLGERAEPISFIGTDVCCWQPQRRFGAWHDRAVFHFLVQPEDRDRYVALTTEYVTPSGVVVLGAFASDGPTHCSGLPTARYDAKGLADTFGSGFVLEHTEREEHTTPTGMLQPFTWVVLRRRQQ